jgi:hypothetical protein
VIYTSSRCHDFLRQVAGEVFDEHYEHKRWLGKAAEWL